MVKIMQVILLFTGLQLINVILNTFKTLIMAKTDNPHASAVINAVTYGFYTAVVQQVAQVSLMVTIPVTIATNIVGVYVSYWLMSKARKDSLWRIETYIKRPEYMPDIQKQLSDNDIQFLPIENNLIIIYSYCQKESAIVRDVLKKYNCKYNVLEIGKTL